MISSYISIFHELSFVLYESPFARYVFIFILYCKHTLFFNIIPRMFYRK